MAGPLTNLATTVNNGLFNVTLDFGPNVFTGSNFWLEIGVRTNGENNFSTLSPRQPILPAPYAIMAASASNLLGTLPATRLSGAIPNVNLPANAGFSGTVSASAYLGNGGGLTNLAAPQLTGTIPLAALPPGVLTNGSANAAFTSSLFVTNICGPVGDNDHPGVLGIADNYYNAKSIYNMSIYGGADYWGSDPEQYSDYTPYFNEDVAAGSPVGQLGLSQYIWNTHILSLGGDNRSCVGVVTTFGTNAEYGNIIEMLPRKSCHASIDSGVFAHPLRLDGFGRVMMGNIPESEHTRFYIGNAYLDLWTGGNTDVPAMLFEQDGLSSSLVTGALERESGLPYWTDGNLNRSQILLSGHPGDGSGLINLNPSAIGQGIVGASLRLTNNANVINGTFSGVYNGNGAGLTNLNTSAIVNGLTTSLVVATPTGTATLFFTNGILQAVNTSSGNSAVTTASQ
jgi:hypothetical protein